MTQSSRLARWVFCCLVAMFVVRGVCAKTLLEIGALFGKDTGAEALQATRRYVSANPGDVDGLFVLAMIQCNQGQLAEAEKGLSDLVDTQRGGATAYNNLAVIYARQGKLAVAKELLQVAIHQSPSYEIAYANLEKIFAVLARDPKQVLPGLNFDLLTTDDRLRRLILNRSVANVVQGSRQEALSKEQGTAESVTGDVQLFVVQWANAWSNKDLEAYFSAYGEAFDYRPSASRKIWQRNRVKRIAGRKKIVVSVEDLSISVSGDAAEVYFLQKYSSGSIQDISHKTLQLAFVEGRWQILAEKTLEAAPAL